jgi:GNAT superfamily N-acetyltransferase
MTDTRIRTSIPSEWRTYKDLRLLALADSPDAFTRTLPEEQARTDTEWESRLLSGVHSRWDLPLLADVAGRPVGLAWGRVESSDPDVAYLYQMWVAPEFRRLGAGRMLLGAIVTWAKAANACCVKLGVTCGDSPAMHLYAGTGAVGEPEPLRPRSELLSQPMRLVLE